VQRHLPTVEIPPLDATRTAADLAARPGIQAGVEGVGRKVGAVVYGAVFTPGEIREMVRFVDIPVIRQWIRRLGNLTANLTAIGAGEIPVRFLVRFVRRRMVRIINGFWRD